MRRALGRGLEALLPGATLTESDANPPDQLAIREIRRNPDQPRRHFDEAALDALAESIRSRGLLQPLVVRATPDGYELIAGERRLRAAERAGLERVPVIVREAQPHERLELALIENVQRENLTPLEEAEAYRHLIEIQGMTQDQVAKAVGKSRPAVANAMRLLSLPDAVKAQLETGELTAGHARAVLALDGPSAQIAFARELVDESIPKHEAERRAQARGARRRTRNVPGADLHWRALADELTRTLGTRVRIHPRGKGGTIEIEFYSAPELDRLVTRLRGAGEARTL